MEERDGRAVTAVPEPPAEETAADAVAERLRALTGLEALDVRVAWQAHEDWAETWKRGLEPRRVGRSLVVTPSWCDPELRPGDRVIVVDPGMAFGNAEHGTTRGCLRLLETLVRPGERVLDVGAGSAVLSIAAALLGAGKVTALEGDPLAVPAARENVERNGVADRVAVEQVWVRASDLPERGLVDGLVANIETGVLRPLLPAFAATVRPGGWLVLSGVPGDEWDAFAPHAEAAGFRVVEVDADGEWRAGRLVREGAGGGAAPSRGPGDG